MDSLNSQKAVKSHPSKVVNDQSNKTTVAKVGHNNQSDLKDTNFEYEDNEWDDVGIGSLIIDLDADIEKSSSTNLESNSLVIPTIGSTENISAPRNSSKSSKDKNSDSDSAEKSKRKEGSNMSTTANSGNKSSKISMDHQATLDKGLKMKIKRTKTGTKTSDSKHEIVKSDHNNGIVSSDDSFTGNNSKKLPNAINIPSSPSSSNKRGNNSHKKEKSKEKSGSKEKLDIPMNQSENPCGCISEKMGNLPSTPCNSTNCTKLKETAPPPAPTQSNRTGSSNHSSSSSSSGSSSTSNATAPGKSEKNSHVNSTKHPKDLITFTEFSKSLSKVSNSIIHSKNEDAKVSSPPMKKSKCDASSKDMVDVCIGTSIGTITEPDCLGPCEPGTSVTLEGIVWHETEGGVLAVNVTWRGKTYVGTLIDCTKHDWAPPRFCDSPTEELDSRLPKGGRAKRGRNSVTSNDVLETRSSVHSKLRNGGSKGRASRNSSSTNVNISTSTAITNTPSTSPTTFSVPRPEKRRKSKDESPPFNGTPTPTTTVNNTPNNPAAAVAQASASKKPKSVASPCAISPVLLECPEQDCSKKYKHANGLKYHQSHAHGINADDDSLTAPESPTQRSQSPDIVKTEDKIDEDSNMPQINFESVKPSIEAISDTAVDRFPIIQKSSSTDATFDSRPENPTKQDPTNTNTPSKFTNISDVEQTSNDSNDVQSSSFYKASNLSKKKSDHKEKMEDSSSDAIGVGGSVNKPENNPARSPAYSDISDDSNIATDNGLADKHNANSEVKKVTEPGPTNLMLAPYNSMYGQFYQGSSFFTPPDSQSTKAINPSPQQPPLIKDPSPLDLINKIQPIKTEPIVPSPSNPNVGKMPHYQHYPYNFIQSNYPYMENNYGNMPTDEKPQGIQIKEELRKENAASPDNIKTKPIKTEPKDIKTESGPPANLQSPQHNMSPYPGNSHMYPSSRHGPSISREEDLQKYFIYPEQRRPPHGGTPTNLSKDERTSQSPTAPQSSSFNKPSKSSSSSSSTPSSSSKHSSSSSKDSKGEEKDVKVKQEGQKPTMETQGPPPPPTSQQYYLPYMTPGSSPFGFPDPMYRNMPFPPSPYNPSYHLQMARFTSPEDLSRNPNTKALDLLQQHASQYYNNHKIHELSERHSQLKSPTSNPKIPISSSPTLTGQSTTTPNANITPSNLPGSNSSPQSLNLKTNEKPERPDLKDPTPGSNGSRPLSPPTQRHVHTHLHTHQLAGIGYHPYPYVNPAVLASQQAVINPFTNPPANK